MLRASRLLLALALASTSDSFAFQAYGPWHDVNTPGDRNLKLYVSTGGNDAGLGSVGDPLRTLTQALVRANAWANSTTGGVTSINVFPGTYTDNVAGESFPLSVPAFGVSIETYNPAPSSAPASRAQLFGPTAFSAPIIDVNLGAYDPNAVSGLPATVIQGLQFELAMGIQISPNLAASNLQVPCAVEIRDNLFCTVGPAPAPQAIVILVGEEETHLNVIENNVFGPTEVPTNPVDVCVTEVCNWESSGTSTLLRGNSFRNAQHGYWLITPPPWSGSMPTQRQPRIQSNFFQLCHEGIALDVSQPIVVNNTFAFGKWWAPFGNVEAIDHGMAAAANAGTIHNNLFWNIPYVDPTNGPTTPVDYVGPLAALPADNRVTPAVPGPSNSPRFVSLSGGSGFDAHPVGSTNAAKDLHLLTQGLISPALDAGAAAFAGSNLTFALNGYTVRWDTSCDADQEPRQTSFFNAALIPDQGADEATEIRLSLGTPASFADELGNLYDLDVVAANLQLAIPLRIETAAPNTTYLVALCSDFTADTPIFANALTPWGNWRLDLGSQTTIAFGTTDSSGLGQIVVSLATAGATLIEGEVYVQAIGYTSPGSPLEYDLSRRIKLEFNEAPPVSVLP